MSTYMVQIDRIVCDVRIYPRISRLDETTQRYVSAMKRGDQFPPIVVTKVNGTLYLVDGYHRLNAALKCGFMEIEAQEIKCRSVAEAYVEGVKRNAAHGEPFKPAERIIITNTLSDLGYTQTEISDILRMDVGEVERNKLKIIERTGPVLIKRKLEPVPEQHDQVSFAPADSSPGKHLHLNGRMMPVYTFDESLIEALAAQAHELWIEHTTNFARNYKVPERTLEQWKHRWRPYHDIEDRFQEKYREWAKRTLAKMSLG